jgi:hypothetical protein
MMTAIAIMTLGQDKSPGRRPPGLGDLMVDRMLGEHTREVAYMRSIHIVYEMYISHLQ